MRRSGLRPVGLVFTVAVAVSVGACSAHIDAGNSQHEQLCTLVEVIPTTPDGAPRSTLVDMLTETSTEARSDLLALTLGFETYDADYDELAEFQDALNAAVRRAAELVSDESSIGPEAEPTPEELANARAFDRELTEEPCSQD